MILSEVKSHSNKIGKKLIDTFNCSINNCGSNDKTIAKNYKDSLDLQDCYDNSKNPRTECKQYYNKTEKTLKNYLKCSHKRCKKLYKEIDTITKKRFSIYKNLRKAENSCSQKQCAELTKQLNDIKNKCKHHKKVSAKFKCEDKEGYNEVDKKKDNCTKSKCKKECKDLNTYRKNAYSPNKELNKIQANYEKLKKKLYKQHFPEHAKTRSMKLKKKQDNTKKQRTKKIQKIKKNGFP